MSNFTQIEIDIEVYKAIEVARSSFSETSNELLRKILGLQSAPVVTTQHNTFENLKAQQAWFGQGVELPHGTQLRMDYNGNIYTAEIIRGRWYVDGVALEEKTPSGAAIAAVEAATGKRVSLNGWVNWEAKLPNGNRWRKISEMRKKK
jgi:hypothetical protein